MRYEEIGSLPQDLDEAVVKCKEALAKAYLCGYIRTVDEERQEYIEQKWQQLAARRTLWRC